MMQDAEYAAARAEFGDFLQDIQRATHTAMNTLSSKLTTAEAELAAILESANRLPDGRAVFRDAHGRVWTAEHARVSEEDAAAIVWREDAPGYEAYVAAQAQTAALQQGLNEIEAYQRDRLGPAQDRFDYEETPMTREEFDAHRAQIEAGMPEAVRALVGPPSGQTAIAPASSAKIDVPTL